MFLRKAGKGIKPKNRLGDGGSSRFQFPFTRGLRVFLQRLVGSTVNRHPEVAAFRGVSERDTQIASNCGRIFKSVSTSFYRHLNLSALSS